MLQVLRQGDASDLRHVVRDWIMGRLSLFHYKGRCATEVEPVAYLTKPVGSRDLIEAVEKAMASR